MKITNFHFEQQEIVDEIALARLKKNLQQKIEDKQKLFD
jgi:hypothetical protein